MLRGARPKQQHLLLPVPDSASRSFCLAVLRAVGQHGRAGRSGLLQIAVPPSFLSPLASHDAVSGDACLSSPHAPQMCAVEGRKCGRTASRTAPEPGGRETAADSAAERVRYGVAGRPSSLRRGQSLYLGGGVDCLVGQVEKERLANVVVLDDADGLLRKGRCRVHIFWPLLGTRVSGAGVLPGRARDEKNVRRSQAGSLQPGPHFSCLSRCMS